MVRKILIVLFLCAISEPSFGVMKCWDFEPDVSEDTSQRAYIPSGPGHIFYNYCGEHSGDDNGCPDGAAVWGIGSSGPGFYTCNTRGLNWAYVNPDYLIDDCTDDPSTAFSGRYEVDGKYVFFYEIDIYGSSGDSKNICKMSLTKAESYLTECESTGGTKNVWWCDCDDPYENDGDYKCKLKAKYGYLPCVRDSDCTRPPIDTTRNPYRHSTAWQCATQIARAKVCAATDCEPGYHIALDENNKSKGFCEQDRPATELIDGFIASAEIKQLSVPPLARQLKVSGPTVITLNCESKGMIEQGGMCVCPDPNKEPVHGKCEYTAEYITGITSNIENTYKNLTDMVAGFGKSEWRDKDGNFNTARLASDSVAGVVLGTVGGVVTAHLVKKAQVKQGFEDMKCSIGGQTVANYGDSFVVGR